MVCFRVKQYFGLHEEKIYIACTAESVEQVITMIKTNHSGAKIDSIFPIEARVPMDTS
ncbi:MAG: hypothetical protein ACUVTD_09545 [Nitrososphaerales archaeon]